MVRALQLARNGEGRVSPNPMVGAVIVSNDKIIGEGFHAFHGGPHAEVNAINSVNPEDRHRLRDSTMYVTLEPCAHHGKTPPCADLIVNTGIHRVVVGTTDPNPLVAGKGIRILEEAGIEVIKGCLEQECKNINVRFIKAQQSEFPWIILKWAQSADGYIAAFNNEEPVSVKFSSPLSLIWMHRERANTDAIIVGANTQRIDTPALNVRFWGGNSPEKFVASGNFNCVNFAKDLRKRGFISLMVEGGQKLLNSFLQAGLYDEIRIETAPFDIEKGLAAPSLPSGLRLINTRHSGNNLILTYRR
ncbi:MAG: bifunctional diaminohydroxyphosphoribosylaminopyrimidine deaminase/5-amino-6-(5-phosphoribosylamino)uracil reductase RibD [Muribaculaceae bacterium]|nr:bifunctional diaminohydroxyphosphoribosylaminopyrimidine deaminase/5-amino-6-(5-phosphoribosylamino)uracil reductase RibD [Muribaculaceae bacterium]